jgi:hypothetical protein
LSQTAHLAGRPERAGWPILATLAAFALAWLVLVAPFLFGDLTIPWDAKAHFYPQLVFLARALHAGDSPFWTPNVFAGHPQIADPQSLIFSPPYLLLAALQPEPSFRQADAVVLVMLWLGGGAVIVYFRDRVWHPAGALVAALAFAFGASAAWRIQHVGEIVSLAWFAITLMLLDRALWRASKAYGLAAGLTAGLMVLGRDQVALLSTYALALFVIWHILAAPQRPWVSLQRAIPCLVSGLVGGLAIATIPLLLTHDLAQQSNRAVIDLVGAERGSLHPASLLTAIVPNLFGADGPLAQFWGPPSPTWGFTDLFLARNMGQVYLGALPILVLIAIGVGRGALWSRPVGYFSFALGAALLYALGRYTPAFRLFYLLPGVDLFRRPADATFLIGALAAILAGYCLHILVSGEGGRPSRRELVAALIVLAALFAGAMALAAFKGTLGLALAPLLRAALTILVAAALIIAIGRLPTAGAVAAAGLLMTADLGFNNGPNESTALPAATYDVLRPASTNPTIALLKARLAAAARPDRRDRVELAAIGFHWPNASLVHDLDHDLGYNPLRLKLFVDVTGAGDQVAVPDQRQFAPLFPSYRSKMADLMGLRFIATGVPVEMIDRALRPGDLALIGRTADAYVYENPRAMPRVLFASQARLADFEQLIRTGALPDVDFAKTVLLDHLPGPDSSGEGVEGRVKILSYRNTEVVIDSSANGPGYVVLNDVWHPGWQADIDGRPAEVLLANVMFRAVAVPSGDHRVRFQFRPFAALMGRP